VSRVIGFGDGQLSFLCTCCMDGIRSCAMLARYGALHDRSGAITVQIVGKLLSYYV